MKMIVNATLITSDKIIERATVWIENGRISAYGEENELGTQAEDDVEVIDANGLYVAPGFVDIHCHGGGGHRAYQNPAGMASFHLQYGTTSILPTFSYNETEQEILSGIDKIIEAQDGDYGNIIAGIHMEGPYINPNYGAITSEIRRVNPAEYQQILRLAGSRIKVWTLAPELDGQQLFMKEAAPYGIVFSVGHSEAEAKTVLESVDYGLRIGCHCTNASGITPSPSLYAGTREVGVDEAVLLSDDIYAEVIPDYEGRHVRPLMLKLILKTKGVDKVIIITDAMDGTGLGDQSIDVNLIKKTAHSPAQAKEYMLGGSLLTMDRAVHNMKRHTGAGMVELFKMASLNPAKVIGIDAEVGSLEVGKRANLIFINEEIDVHQVMLDGEIVKNGILKG